MSRAGYIHGLDPRVVGFWLSTEVGIGFLRLVNGSIRACASCVLVCPTSRLASMLDMFSGIRYVYGKRLAEESAVLAVQRIYTVS